MSRIISWSYYRGSRTEKESLTIYYADNEEVAKFVEEHGFFSKHYGYPLIPGIRKVYNEGYTTKSMKHGKLHSNLLEKHPELERKILTKEKPFVNFFDSYYFDFSSYEMDNLISYFPEVEKNDFKKLIECKSFIKKELFINPDFINAFNRFITFQVRSYSSFKSKLSNILLSCKYQDRDFFEYLTETFEIVKSLSEEISVVGQKAYLLTLKPGQVDLIAKFGTTLKSSSIAEWTGEKLIVDFENKDTDFSKIEIYPKENMIVKIVDVSTFDEKTKLYY